MPEAMSRLRLQNKWLTIYLLLAKIGMPIKIVTTLFKELLFLP